MVLDLGPIGGLLLALSVRGLGWFACALRRVDMLWWTCSIDAPFEA